MHPVENEHKEDYSASMEMPRYKSHKQVWAPEIATINRMTPGKVALTFRDKGYAPITFDAEDSLFVRYAPIQGDFLVQYADGYKSFSPRKAFLEGYTREAV